MWLCMHKRSDVGGDCGDPELLGAVGLGNFAWLGFPDPPDGLEVGTSYESTSGRIAISFRNEGIYASPADLVTVLGLPLAAVSLPARVGIDFFSFAEKIATVRRFVCDRVLLGGGEDRGTS
jgi:hypothetical protein